MTKKQRPVLSVPISPTLEIACVAGLMASLVVAFSAWLVLPETIPIHFGVDGKPDGWGDKQSIWMLPIMGIVNYGLLTLVRGFPHTFNYPLKITEENAPRLYQIACSMLDWLKLEIIWTFAYITWQIWQVGSNQATTLGIWFLPFFIIVLIGTNIYWLLQMFQSR